MKLLDYTYKCLSIGFLVLCIYAVAGFIDPTVRDQWVAKTQQWTTKHWNELKGNSETLPDLSNPSNATEENATETNRDGWEF